MGYAGRIWSYGIVPWITKHDVECWREITSSVQLCSETLLCRVALQLLWMVDSCYTWVVLNAWRSSDEGGWSAQVLIVILNPEGHTAIWEYLVRWISWNGAHAFAGVNESHLAPWRLFCMVLHIVLKQSTWLSSQAHRLAARRQTMLQGVKQTRACFMTFGTLNNSAEAYEPARRATNTAQFPSATCCTQWLSAVPWRPWYSCLKVISRCRSARWKDC